MSLDGLIESKSLGAMATQHAELLAKAELPELLAILLGDAFDGADRELPVSKLITEYEDAIRSADGDWWIYGKLAAQMPEPIYLAHADEVGFKRGVRGEDSRPNDLFRVDTDGGLIVSAEPPERILEELCSRVRWS